MVSTKKSVKPKGGHDYETSLAFEFSGALLLFCFLDPQKLTAVLDQREDLFRLIRSELARSEFLHHLCLRF